MRKGVHHAAGDRDELGAGTPLDCLKCHGQDVHGMLPVGDPQSPVFLDKQTELCGSCHQDYLATYNRSVHGHGLHASGLLVTAVCADCHGAHDIYYAADRGSTLHADKVAGTCGRCHKYLEQRLEQSVHGRGGEAAAATHATSAKGPMARKPCCVDCHQGHDQPEPRSVGFRLAIPNRCGNCHTALSVSYGMSLHGELTQLGYEPAAKCSDCHGAHDIRPLGDAHSRLSARQRVETCRQCHPQAVENFTAFDPHANPKDQAKYPALYRAYHWTENVLLVLCGLFLLHAAPWYARSLTHRLRYGRHRTYATQQYAIVRFRPSQRAVYGLMVLSSIGLALTGLPLKYGHQSWARDVAGALGGFGTTSLWHHMLAVVVLCTAGVHVAHGIRLLWHQRGRNTAWKDLLWGHDSLLPNRRDLKDVSGMIRWFLGIGGKPGFERWTYWEKLDYWGAGLALAIIGLSGLMLWWPNLFSIVLPGQALNLAHVIHSDTVLAMAVFLLLVHVFNTHLRPENSHGSVGGKWHGQ